MIYIYWKNEFWKHPIALGIILCMSLLQKDSVTLFTAFRVLAFSFSRLNLISYLASCVDLYRLHGLILFYKKITHFMTFKLPKHYRTSINPTTLLQQSKWSQMIITHESFNFYLLCIYFTSFLFFHHYMYIVKSLNLFELPSHSRIGRGNQPSVKTHFSHFLPNSGAIAC